MKRNLSIAVALAFVIGLLVGNDVLTLAQSRPSAPQPTQWGRYQLVVNPEVRADTFLLDTETGRMWRRVSYTNLIGEPSVWELFDRVDSYEELQAWGARHVRK